MHFLGEIYTRGIYIPPSEVYAMCGVIFCDILEPCGRRIITGAIVDHGRESTSGREGGNRHRKKAGSFMYLYVIYLSNPFFRNPSRSSSPAQPPRAVRLVHWWPSNMFTAAIESGLPSPPRQLICVPGDPQKRKQCRSHTSSKRKQIRVAATGRFVSPTERNQ